MRIVPSIFVCRIHIRRRIATRKVPVILRVTSLVVRAFSIHLLHGMSSLGRSVRPVVSGVVKSLMGTMSIMMRFLLPALTVQQISKPENVRTS